MIIPSMPHLSTLLILTLSTSSMGPSARVAVELSEQAARELVRAILEVLVQAEASGNLESQR